MRAIAGWLIVLLLGAVPAAEASTLPRVDFERGNIMAGFGLMDVAADYALLNGWSVGACWARTADDGLWGYMAGAAVRSTNRLWQFDGGPSLGVTFSAGEIRSSGGIEGPSTIYWVQPALNVAWPVASQVMVRATLGPLFAQPASPSSSSDGNRAWYVVPLVPNLELAFRPTSHLELIVGGNSLVSFRMTL